MGVKTQVEFIAAATVGVRTWVYDDDDTLSTPTSITITIKDPDGTAQVSASAMTENATGIYDYFYNTTTSTAKGSWTGFVTVTDGTGDTAKTSLDDFEFTITQGVRQCHPSMPLGKKSKN